MSLREAAEKFQAFCSQFAKESDCFGPLFESKWPNGYRCPRCDHPHFYLISTRRIPLYECRSCHTQTSLIVGTIMEGSRTPLHRWFQAIYLHSQPRCINARQLSLAISVTYKTAWLICHKIRHAMTESESDRWLAGIVRISDSVYCKRMTSSFDWHKQEQPLLIGASEQGDGSLSPIVIKVQSKILLKDKYDFPDPTSFIRDHVNPQDVAKAIVTKRYGRGANKQLSWMGYDVTWWIGSTFLGVGPKHLQAYLDQYCYYYNRAPSVLHGQLLADCIRSSRITYPELVKANDFVRSIRLPRVARQSSLKTG